MFKNEHAEEFGACVYVGIVQESTPQGMAPSKPSWESTLLQRGKFLPLTIQFRV